jgi:hypothetical protein
LYFDLVKGWAGWEPWRWHLLDLIRHVADCGLLFFLVWTLWRKSFLAFAAAVLFGLNGARPEVAVWNGASCDSLAAFFVLAALLCVFRSPAGRISFAALAAANIFVALAILSKESAYAAPILLLAFAAASGRLRQRPVLAALASTAMVSAALFAYRWVLFRGPGGYMNAVTGRPQILSLKFVPTAKALLVRLWSVLLLPLNWRAENKELLLPAVLLACTVFLLFAWTRSYPRMAVRVLLLATALALVPAIHLALIGDTALGSRILYLPGLTFAVAWALVLGSIQSRRMRNVALAAVVVCLGCGLAHNLLAWHANALAADTVCTAIAAHTPAQLPAMPGQLHGAFFLGGGLPDCVAMKQAESRRRFR